MVSRKKQWWKECIVYQVYPRSFLDTNGDGIGDLPGIIQRLDYIQELGADLVWLTPVFESPNNDNGYDITNYCAIGKEYGTLEDFDQLIEQAHARGIKIILDLVLNHTSDEHPWFVESRSSRLNPKRNYYYWRDGKDGKEPNNWSSGFEPSCWEYDPRTDQYYLHYYSKKMPDLNWEEPAVRKEIYRVMNFWLDRGVDGFRFDSLNLIKKLLTFEDAVTPDPFAEGYYYDMEKIFNLPGIMDFLHEMHAEVLEGRQVFTVGETSTTSSEDAFQYVQEDGRALQMVFNFEPVELEPFDLAKFKDIQKRWYTLVEQGGFTCTYLSNHDQPRQVSKFGDDRLYRVESARLLGTLNLMLFGVPFIYQGEEIGMTNISLGDISLYNDISTINKYTQLVSQGMEPRAALEYVEKISRDNARTPMQWNADTNAGFSTGTPWLHVNPNHVDINVESNRADSDSVLAHYKKLAAFRRQNPAVVYGDYSELQAGSDQVYAFRRRYEQTELLVVLNFSSQPAATCLDLTRYELCLNSHGGLEHARAAVLQPWQSLVLRRVSD